MNAMSIYEEVNILMDQLIAAWGSVVINCDGKTCVVSDPLESRVFESLTLIESLRLAADFAKVGT